MVNDGSSDGGEIALANCNFRNVRIINQKNAGVSAARNCGIAAAKTEFVALLDADDQWMPHFLEEISVLIKKFPQAGVFSTNYQYKQDNERYITPKLHNDLCPSSAGIMKHFLHMMAEGDLPLTMSSIVIRHSLVNDIGGFPVGEPMGEDQDFLFRAALAKPIAYSPKVLALYVLDSENRACVKNLPAAECPFSKRLTFMAEHLPLNDDQKHYLRKCSAAHLLHLIRRNIQAGRLEVGKRLLNDERCNLKPVHKHYWLARYYVKTAINRLTSYAKATDTVNELSMSHTGLKQE